MPAEKYKEPPSPPAQPAPAVMDTLPPAADEPPRPAATTIPAPAPTPDWPAYKEMSPALADTELPEDNIKSPESADEPPVVSCNKPDDAPQPLAIMTHPDEPAAATPDDKASEPDDAPEASPVPSTTLPVTGALPEYREMAPEDEEAAPEYKATQPEEAATPENATTEPEEEPALLDCNTTEPLF